MVRRGAPRGSETRRTVLMMCKDGLRRNAGLLARVSLRHNGNNVTTSSRPAKLFETMGSVRTSADPVRRNRPDRRSWSTDCLMAGRGGGRCTSSMVARSRPSGAHDGDATIPASFAAVKSGGGIVMIRVPEGLASCRRLHCAIHCTICSNSACFAECQRSRRPSHGLVDDAKSTSADLTYT